MDWKQLIRLYQNIPNIICITDPDVHQNINKKKFNEMLRSSHSLTNNIFILPGDFAIEVMLWKYVGYLNKNSKLFKDHTIRNRGININYIHKEGLRYGLYENNQSSLKGNNHIENLVRKCKKWYKSNKYLNSIYMDYLIESEKDIVTPFVCGLSLAIKRVYKRINNPFIY